MQKRLFNYKEDDSTFLLNQITSGVIPSGVYFGFDANLDNTLVLKLIHSTSGISEIDIDLNESIVGLIKSKQGTIIKEDNTIEFPIDAGDVLPRIDLIVCSHSFSEIVGGSQALYSVLKGIPAISPVKPTLTNVNEQIEIGSLYVPANMLLLNGAGVIYTKADQPQFANNTIRILNCLQKNENLNDLASKIIARQNLEVYSSSEVDTAISNALSGISSFLQKSENLNDLSNKITARSNLNVYSQTQVDTLISDAIANLAIIGTALDATQLVLTDSSGHLISEAKKTALNKDFTTAGGDFGSGTDVARGDHKHDGIYYTETEIDTKLGNVFTRGMIIDWSGLLSEIPVGWALCDGNNGTPNLSGKFIVGYDAGVLEYNTIGKTGGSTTHTLTSANLPQTFMNYTTTTGTNYTLDYTPGSGASGVVDALSYGTGSISFGYASPTAIDNRPPFYVLAKIMKL